MLSVESTSVGAVVIDRVDDSVRHALSTDAIIVPVRAEDLPTSDPVAAVLRYARVGQQVSHPG